MKKHLKKFLSLLLVATSFNFLPMIGKTCSSVLTYAENNTEQNQDFVRYGFVPVKGTPFCIEEKIYYENPELYSTNSLNQVFQKAKDKIYEKLGLSYPDGLNKIYVKEDLDGGCYRPCTKVIEIGKYKLFNGHTLPHEMIHALLGHFLGIGIYHLNLGINEGLATQANEFDDYNDIMHLPTFTNLENILFYDCFFSFGHFENWDLFYSLHQHLIHDWLEAQGKDVVKKWLERVKNGEDSVKVFLELGGDKIVEKYKKEQESFLSSPLSAVVSIFKFLRKLF